MPIVLSWVSANNGIGNMSRGAARAFLKPQTGMPFIEALVEEPLTSQRWATELHHSKVPPIGKGTRPHCAKRLGQMTDPVEY